MANPSESPAGKDLDLETALARYRAWLEYQSLARGTRAAYLAQAEAFVSWLLDSGRGARALSDSGMRDRAVWAYKRRMKAERKWTGLSLKQGLAAIESFYRCLMLERPEVRRQVLRRPAPPGTKAFHEALRTLPPVSARPATPHRAAGKN